MIKYCSIFFYQIISKYKVARQISSGYSISIHYFQCDVSVMKNDLVIFINSIFILKKLLAMTDTFVII